MGPDQPPTDGPPASPDGPARPPGPSASPAEIGIVGLILVSGIATWVTGIRTLGYDYDEVLRAHSTWLASQGLRPYRDFLDFHPPYFGILATALQAGSVEPSALLQRLRIFSAAGNALFLAALAVLGAASTRSGRLWGLVGVLLVAFHPAILVFLAEFRIDGWGYALMAWSIHRYRRPSRGPYRDLEFGLATTVASLWLCPKLALLPPMLVASERLVGWRSIRDAVLGGLAYLAGVLAATALFGLYLTALGIGWDRAFDLLVRYHAISNANAGTHFGLLRAILNGGVLSWVILAAAIARAVHHLRRRARPDPYEVAVVAWLALQPLLVNYPYKQYFGPWFLLASGFVGCLVRDVSDLLGRARLAPLIAACGLIVLADVQAARGWWDAGQARSDERLIRWMNRVTRPEDRVVACPPLHPIDRFDTFFLWINTFDAAGFDSERILARLPRLRGYARTARYREELEAHPPALAVVSGDRRMVPHPSRQFGVLTEYLRRHGYVAVRLGTVLLTLRPDCYERARRDGLLESSFGLSVAPAG